MLFVTQLKKIYLKFIFLNTSRVYSSKRRDHNGSFQSQHFLHGCTRKFSSNSYFLLSTPCKASIIISIFIVIVKYSVHER